MKPTSPNKITEDYTNNFYFNQFQKKYSLKLAEDIRPMNVTARLTFNDKSFGKTFSTSKIVSLPQEQDKKSILLHKLRKIIAESTPSYILANFTSKNTKSTTTTTTEASTIQTTFTSSSTTTTTTTMETTTTTSTTTTTDLPTSSSTSSLSSIYVSYSPIDELLIEKISFIKTNKLNKTQMSNHLDLIKNIFVFKNRTKMESLIQTISVSPPLTTITTTTSTSTTILVQTTTTSTTTTSTTTIVTTIYDTASYYDSEYNNHENEENSILDWNLLLNLKSLTTTTSINKITTSIERFTTNQQSTTQATKLIVQERLASHSASSILASKANKTIHNPLLSSSSTILSINKFIDFYFICFLVLNFLF